MAINITLTINTTLELEVIEEALDHLLEIQISQLDDDNDLKDAEWSELQQRACATRRTLVGITGKITTQTPPRNRGDRTRK